VKEEDIVTNTAGLELFSGVSVSRVTALLHEAIELVQSHSETTHSEILQGIKSRLEFRKQLLDILSSTSRKTRRSVIEECLQILTTISSTLKLGKEVPNSFTTKIQRKLSIQVPPRPMVTIDPKEAIETYKTMLENLLEIETLYEYKSPHEVFVFPLLLRFLITEFL
jgi:N-alpha-acetyltransferase 35, NatC auxiliary subunit